MEPSRLSRHTIAGGLTTAEPRHNLVDSLSSFVGREREIKDLVERLATIRLLTLVGAGGVGKTRLALRVGAELVPSYPSGVWLVELAPLGSAATIPQAIAAALGVYESPDRDLLRTIVDALRARGPLLLVLDNCEHLVAGVAAVVARLLHDCPDLSILATSREALGVAGEAIHRVPSLSQPDEAVLAHPDGDVVAILNEHEATHLFVERARAVHEGFVVSERNARSIAQICRRLDGIPLAIELAAARARLLTPQQISARLDDRYRLLIDGSRTALPRHRTLHAAIAWSYDLLSEPEQATLRRLAVFAGGCTLEAAERVCCGEQTVGSDDPPPADSSVPPTDLLDLVGRLVDKSLVTVDLSGTEGRYSMLDTIREYALERSEASGEAHATRRRHAKYFLGLAERVEPELYGPDQAIWADRLAMEHDNFQAALAWALGAGADAVTALRLAAALGWIWSLRSFVSETRWLDAALTATAELTADVEVVQSRAKALRWLAWIGRAWNDPPRTVALGEESLALSHAIGDRPAMAYTLVVLGMLLRDLRDYPRARASTEEGIALARELGEPRTTAHGLYVLASIMFYERQVPVRADLTAELSTVDRAIQRSATGRTEVSLPFSAPPGTWVDLPRAPADQRAIGLIEESLSVSRQLGDLWGVAVALTGGGGLTAHAIVSGDFERATKTCAESLDLYQRIGDVRMVSVVLRAFAHVALGKDEPRRAARLIAAFRRALAATGVLLQRSVWLGDEVEIAALRSRLPDGELTAAWEEGRAMSLEQAIAYALRRTDPFQHDGIRDADPQPPGATSAARALSALTPREREVAILVGRGYSNRRIAEELVIAEKTAEVHARNIREKLGLETRAQIAAWVVQQELLSDD